MIPNYQKEIADFIEKQLIPLSTQQSKSLTLPEIYGLVTNVYPKKWIDITDVCEVLRQLGYTPTMDVNEKGVFASFYKFT